MLELLQQLIINNRYDWAIEVFKDLKKTHTDIDLFFYIYRGKYKTFLSLLIDEKHIDLSSIPNLDNIGEHRWMVDFNLKYNVDKHNWPNYYFIYCDDTINTTLIEKKIPPSIEFVYMVYKNYPRGRNLINWNIVDDEGNNLYYYYYDNIDFLNIILSNKVNINHLNKYNDTQLSKILSYRNISLTNLNWFLSNNARIDDNLNYFTNNNIKQLILARINMRVNFNHTSVYKVLVDFPELIPKMLNNDIFDIDKFIDFTTNKDILKIVINTYRDKYQFLKTIKTNDHSQPAEILELVTKYL